MKLINVIFKSLCLELICMFHSMLPIWLYFAKFECFVSTFYIKRCFGWTKRHPKPVRHTSVRKSILIEVLYIMQLVIVRLSKVDICLRLHTFHRSSCMLMHVINWPLDNVTDKLCTCKIMDEMDKLVGITNDPSSVSWVIRHWIFTSR